MRNFVALLLAVAIGVGVAIACTSTIDRPPRLDDGGIPPTTTGTTTNDGGVGDDALPPDAFDPDATSDDSAFLDDTGDDTNIDDTYDPETEYLPAPDCGIVDGEYDGAVLPDIPPGSRFCELYRDFIHVEGAAKCQTYHCHGGEDGFKHLSMGYDVDSCYAAITTHVAKYIPPSRTLVAPGPGALTRSALIDYIGDPPPDAAGVPPDAPFMPQVFDWLGNRKLTPEEVVRFKIWLRRGAPND